MFGKKGFTAAACFATVMVITSVAEAAVNKPGFAVPMPVAPVEFEAIWRAFIMIMFGI